jgi:rhodanese-related sulfurtransferase
MIEGILMSAILTSSVFAEFLTIDTEKMQVFLKDKSAIFIDIRRVDEFKQYGIIENSHKLTFFDNRGEYDIDKWMSKFIKIVKNKEQPFVLICAHANRTKIVGNFLSTQAGYKNVYDLEGGINYGWIDKGLQTIKE